MDKSKKLKDWLKFYYSGVLLLTLLISLSIVTLLFANTILNLQETILVISLISPYLILYLQYIRNKKEAKVRLKIIAKKIEALIRFVVQQSDLINKINYAYEKQLNDLKPKNKRNLENLLTIVPNLIKDIKNTDINDLIRLRIYSIEPENQYIHFTDSYLIGVRGIIEMGTGDNITSNKDKISKILKELYNLI